MLECIETECFREVMSPAVKFCGTHIYFENRRNGPKKNICALNDCNDPVYERPGKCYSALCRTCNKRLIEDKGRDQQKPILEELKELSC